MGGLARRATLIEQARASQGALLVVDAGNSLMGETLSLRSDGRVLLEAMNLMRYDALGIGTGELIKGPQVLAERSSEAAFPLLSSNLVTTGTGEPVLEPYAVIERGGVRFGVIGITNPASLQGLEAAWPGVSILAPEAVLPGYLDALKEQVDVTVVLSLLGLEADKALAGAVAGIDVIVGGNERYVLTEASTVGSTVIVQAGYDGEWMGRLDLRRSEDGYSHDQFRILYMRPDVADNPEMKALVQRYYGEYPE